MIDRANIPLVWQVVIVPESETHVIENTHRAHLCATATMMGWRAFCHRVCYCNYPTDDEIPHCHIENGGSGAQP